MSKNKKKEKDKDFDFGRNEVGTFIVLLTPAFGCEEWEAENCPFFEILVHERKDGVEYYVDVAGDPRFDWFGHMRSFERPLTQDDLVEYNSMVGTKFHKIAMPTWKLANHSIPRLLDLCRKASKKKA